MKIEIREVIQKHTVYISEDGIEFPTEVECEEHEQQITEHKLYDIADKLPHFEMDLPGADYDTDYVWSYCNTKEEVEAVFVRYLCPEERLFYSDEDFNKNSLPGWVLTATDDAGYGFICDAKNYLGLLSQWLDEVKKKINDINQKGGCE